MKDYYFANKEYVDSKIVTMERKDIYNALLLKETEHMRIDEAFIKNGFVFIIGIVKANWTGQFEEKVIPDKYLPVTEIHGSTIYYATSDDNSKVQNISIKATGELYIWIAGTLRYNEKFQIMYPL